MIPESGGEYAYLFRCYGQLYAFLFSWTCNWILKPSGIAIVCLVCGQYITQPFYLNGGAPTWMCKGMVDFFHHATDPRHFNHILSTAHGMLLARRADMQESLTESY